MEISLTKEEKILKLKQEFKQMDSDQDGLVNYNELLFNLDKVNEGKPFDRAIASQLLTSTDKSKGNKISEEEFIRFWLDAEQTLREKISRNNMEIKKAQQSIQENEAKLNAYKLTEDKLLKEGKLYEVSTLVVTIIEAQNVDYLQSNVTISVNEQTYSSSTVPGQFPQYNSQHKLTGVQAKDGLAVVLMDPNDETDQVQQMISLQELLDQKIHDKWVILTSPQKPQSEIKVHLQLQYIYSKSRICQESIAAWTKIVEDLEAQNQAYNNDLVEMYKPFDFISTIKTKPSYLTEIRPQDRTNVEDLYEPKFAQVPPKPLHPIFFILTMAALALLFVSMLSFDYKYHMFIDLSVAFWIVTIYALDVVPYNFVNILIGIVCLCISISIEVIWFSVYEKNWWLSVYIEDGALLKMRRYTYFASIFSFVVKGALFVILVISLFMVKNTRNYQTPGNLGLKY